jgi:endoglucanase
VPLKIFSIVGLIIASFFTVADAAERIIYDESAATQWRALQRASESTAAAADGMVGLDVRPTQWHKPLLILPERTDFRPYDQLELDIRSPEGSMDPTLTLWDYAMGTTRTLAAYTSGGVVDATWQHVTIPLADLASDAFPLDSVFVLMVGSLANPRPIYMDNIRLTRVKGPALGDFSMCSDRAITVTVEHLDPVASADPAGYSLTSDTDPNYIGPVHPVAVGSDRQAVGVTDGGRSVVAESRLHLLMPMPIAPGQTYRLNLSGLVGVYGGTVVPDELTLAYDPNRVSPSIQVNQVGYAPSAPKLAYVGNWLGDLGPMPVDATIFRLVDADTGDVVHVGSLVLRGPADPQSGNDVYEADFSEMRTPGRYVLEVPGLGRSYPFDVADTVYDRVYRTVMRSFYHRRNTTLDAPYADPGYERDGIAAVLDGIFHPVLSSYPLSVGESAFTYRPIAPGWFDAGDYGHYVHNAAPIWGAIGLALDLGGPGLFTDGELGIPESANGIPDILDELTFGMDWALSMQDEADGGVYWRIASGTWDQGLPYEVDEPRFIYEKTTRATAQLAAMGAIYARLISPYDPDRAEAALLAARSAWTFTQTHPVWPAEGTLYQNPVEYPGGGTYAVPSAKPALLWAAAELYRTTGEPGFRDAYRSLEEQVPVDVTAAPRETFPYWAMAMAQWPNRDPILAEEARRGLMIAADVRRDWADQNPFRAAKHPSPQFTGWSNFSASVMATLPLMQARYLSGLPVYRDQAWISANATLGGNPLSRGFITGVGDNPPMDPLDLVSLNDANLDPVRGLVVPGPIWHLPATREPYISANAAYYPPESPATEGDYASAYPVLRRWVDTNQLVPMSEGTVQEAAFVAVAFGLLRDDSAPLPQATTAYDWDLEHPKAARVYAITDLPPAEVLYLTPAQVAEFGGGIGVAGDAWLSRLTPDQVAAIDAPDVPYWVARLSPDQQGALTAAQIGAFQQWSLLTALPASKVALIPVVKIPALGATIAQTSDAWKAALTDEQRAALTDEQLTILAKAGL